MERKSLPQPTHLTMRSILLALILIPFNSYWILNMSYVWNSNRPTNLSLLFNVLFVLLALMMANAFLRRWTPRRAFSQTELLTIYAILCQGSAFQQIPDCNLKG